MRIESSNYLSALEALKNANSSASQTETTTSSQAGELDAYIPSNSDEEILYANYNDILTSFLQSVQASASTTSSSTETTSIQAVDSTIKSLVSSISESLRCNEDTILSTLESLGLSPEDLLDPDNISTLANALNENAAALGLPTVDDLDQIISDLAETVESTVNSLESDYSLTDEELTAILEQLKSRPFDETTLSDILAALAEAEESEA